MHLSKVVFSHSVLRNLLEQKSSEAEAARGFINNLDAQLAKKDLIINEQKKLVNDTSYEYDAQLKVSSLLAPENCKYDVVRDL